MFKRFKFHYVIDRQQVKKFNSNDKIVTTYEDLLGNFQTNLGYIVGENKGPTNSPILFPTIDLELYMML